MNLRSKMTRIALKGILTLSIICLVWLAWAATSGTALAADPTGIGGTADSAVDYVWILICGFLVMFMQAGFAMVETGFCRAKNANSI